MISVSFEMVFASVLFAALLGAVSGALYLLFQSFFTLISSYDKRWLKKQSKEKEKRGIFTGIFDCFFVLAIGITYIVSCYVFLDGVFDIYSLIALTVSFCLSNKTLCLILHSNNST